MKIIEKVDLAEKLSLFADHYHPRLVGELNGQHVKIAKIKGEFVWHSHKNEDELFLVIKGWFVMEFRGRKIRVDEGEMIIVPRGLEHRPVAEEEASVLLFEPASTINTGEVQSDLTRNNIERI